MKKNKLLLLLIPVLALMGCDNNKIDDSSSSITSTTSTTNIIIQTVTIYYYSSIYESYAGTRYYTGTGTSYELIDDIPEDPTSIDPAFNVFVGWSTQPLIATSDDLWDFEVDTIPGNLYPAVLTLYGIWDYVE